MTMVSTVTVAARPGVFSGSFVSSFIVRVTSQPQKMKIDSDRPAAKALNDETANGLNHAQSNGMKSKALPLTACTIAATAKKISTTTWKVDEHVLQLLRGLHVAVRDEGRTEHEQQADGDVDPRHAREVGERLVAGDLREQQEQEVDGDPGEVGEHQDGRGDQAPAGEPADPRAEGARRPGERGARVGHPVVQLAVAEGHQQHRDEADEDDRRDLGADDGCRRADRGGEGVGRRDARDADDDRADEADRAGAQALLGQSAGAFAGGGGKRRRGACGSSSLLSFRGEGARDDDHRHGKLVQHLRRGRAEEEPPGLGEAAGADERRARPAPSRGARPPTSMLSPRPTTTSLGMSAGSASVRGRRGPGRRARRRRCGSRRCRRSAADRP